MINDYSQVYRTEVLKLQTTESTKATNLAKNYEEIL